MEGDQRGCELGEELCVVRFRDRPDQATPPAFVGATISKHRVVFIGDLFAFAGGQLCKSATLFMQLLVRQRNGLHEEIGQVFAWTMDTTHECQHDPEHLFLGIAEVEDIVAPGAKFLPVGPQFVDSNAS